MPIASAERSISRTVFTIKQPGDFFAFDVDIGNAGSIDAMIDLINNSYSNEYNDFLDYEIKYSDNIDLNENDLLSAGQTEHVKVLIKFKDDIEEEDIPDTDIHIEPVFSIDYIQSNEDGEERETGTETNKGDFSFVSDTVSKTFGDNNFTNAVAITGNGIVTYSSSNPSVATVDSETGEVTIVGAGKAIITATITATDEFEYLNNRVTYTLNIDKKDDVITLEERRTDYTGNSISANEATSLSGLPITYTYYGNTTCNGEPLSETPKISQLGIKLVFIH